MKNARRIIVIGAGPGGLATAMLLSSKGYDVQLYEKQAYFGGRTSRLSIGPYHFDRGPTFFMMPHLLEELFQEAGGKLSDFVEMKEIEPLYTLKFGKEVFNPTTNKEQMKAEIERLFPGNSEGYERFMNVEGDKFDHVEKLLQQPFSKLTHFINRNVFKALPKLNAFDTVYGRLSKYFKDERLKWAFSFQAKYLGMSPWECPGTFTILSYLEHRYGLFHPIGGLNRLMEAMVTMIRKNGGQLTTGQGVKQILIEDGKAAGVELENGTTDRADFVIINADFGYAATNLFPSGTLRKYSPERLAKKKLSCSTFMLYLGLDTPVNLPHHMILFAEDYQKNVNEMTKDHVLSEDPSIYIHNPSLIDSTLAPPGHSALYMLMPVPNTTADIDWMKEKEELRNLMIDRLAKETGQSDIRSRITAEHIITPHDWEHDMNIYKGATFSFAHSLDQMMYFRPHNRFEEVPNCYLTGGGTHPGSGLPTIFESARISANLLIQQDEQSTVPQQTRKENSL